MDTNVLVSAFIKPQSNSARILRLVLQGNFDIIVNEHILVEYYEVLARPKFNLNPDKVQVILEFIRSKSIKAPALAQSFHLPDSDDETFLEAALASHANALITGNKRHFPEKSCSGQKVLTPQEFLRELS